jgi:hypothetical protein
MRKVSAVLFALAVLITPYADAKTCAGISCNYIDAATNSGFENTPNHGQSWNYDAGVTFVTENSCYNTYVAALDNGEAIWRFPYVDDTYSSFKVQFRAFLPGDTNNFYDELKVTVKNNATQVTETMYLHGNSYDTQCGFVNFYLSNDYSNANVTVTFESGSLSSHVWQIDDVGFFAYY